MRVLITNHSGFRAGYLAGKYEGHLGHLYSPGGMRGPWDFMPFALDNGKFSAAERDWDPDAFLGLLYRADTSSMTPLWVVVPDVLGDRDGTLREWDTWAPRLRPFHWPLAMAVQDGMTPEDVPDDAAVVFVGGTTDWKRETLHMWCDAFARVHVGRINTERWLWECFNEGAESCDGTGWFRGDKRQLAGLINYLERRKAGKGCPQTRLA